MKTQFVSSLQEGDTVDDYFLAVRKDLRDTAKGGKFLGMVFRDRSGDVGGILWNNAENIAQLFELGDVVNVKGTVATYQDRLQVRVNQVLPLKENEYATEDLVYVPEDTTDILDNFRGVLSTIENKWLKTLVEAFLEDSTFMDRFTNAAAGKRWHHAWKGGLLQHCYEMARIADTMAELFPNLNRDLLLAGVFLHDIGKIHEMSHDLYVDYTTVGKLVGHIEIGCEMVREKIRDIDGFPTVLKMELLHLILSHHGELEQGSPVLPKTVEAMALFLIDNLDAQVDAFTKVIEETQGQGKEWSDYLATVSRQVWAKRRAQGED